MECQIGQLELVNISGFRLSVLFVQSKCFGDSNNIMFSLNRVLMLSQEIFTLHVVITAQPHYSTTTYFNPSIARKISVVRRTNSQLKHHNISWSSDYCKWNLRSLLLLYIPNLCFYNQWLSVKLFIDIISKWHLSEDSLVSCVQILYFVMFELL